MADDRLETVSVAIETSCRAGGLALGVGASLRHTVAFDAATRRTTQLVCHLRDLLASEGLGPADVDHVYISAGPGGFTGLRIGISVVRTMAQLLPGLRCVAVPTVSAVADGARNLDWQRLGVVMAAKGQEIYAAMFTRQGDRVVPDRPPAVTTVEDFMTSAPRPLAIAGEALAHCDFSGQDIEVLDPQAHLPAVESVWRVGREMAATGLFTEYHHLLPIYARRPEAVRLWDERHSGGRKK